MFEVLSSFFPAAESAVVENPGLAILRRDFGPRSAWVSLLRGPVKAKGHMVATFCLLSCALVTAQAADRPEFPLKPRLVRGQELVYRGKFEEVVGQGVQFKRSYRLETTVFILDALPKGLNAALLTVLELRALRPGRGAEAAASPRSVRLELARVSPQGRVEWVDRANLAVPLEGPPTAECGAFVEGPGRAVGRGAAWQVGEPGRPQRTWEVTGTELVHGTRCVKLVGEQKSADWDRPRADRTAWRRVDTVWVAPALGVAFRVQRKVERREPARKQATEYSLLRYELMNRFTYWGPLYEDRRREIMHAKDFADKATPFLRKPGEYENHLAALLKRIEAYQERQRPVEPYCKAITQVKTRIEAARRGEAAPEPPPEEGPAAAAVATVGRLAPDFVASSLLGTESVRLHHLFGRPVLVVFYRPSSPTAAELLRFANGLRRQGVTVLGMAVYDDAAAVKEQHAKLGLHFPVLAGQGFTVTYGVDSTPRLILLDAKGIVRGTYTGWGSEIPVEINAELKRWLRP
jgi:peroxiredoxin